MRGNWGPGIDPTPFRMWFTRVSLIMIGWHLWMYFYISSFPIKTESVRTLRRALKKGPDAKWKVPCVRSWPHSRNNEMNLEGHAGVAVDRWKNGAYILEGLPATNLHCDASSLCRFQSTLDVYTFEMERTKRGGIKHIEYSPTFYWQNCVSGVIFQTSSKAAHKAKKNKPS